MGMDYSKKCLRQEFFDRMVSTHGDKCMICSKHVRHLVIDHDHGTGLMRGLLCMKHNGGLGFFGHDPDLLRSAADYLENDTFLHLRPNDDDTISTKHVVTTTRPNGLTRVIRTTGGYNKAELKKELNRLINDNSFRCDAERSRELTRLFDISYSAAQSQVSRATQWKKQS